MYYHHLILFRLTIALLQGIYGLDVDNLGTSCDDIYDKNPSSHGKSGQYLINNTEQLQLVYCEMKLMETWIEVVDFNTSKQITCPEGWATIKTNDLRMCGSTSSSAGCYSTIFSLDNGTSYHEIRGMVRGYQKGTTDSFDSHYGFRDINTTHVDGVSIILGSTRKGPMWRDVVMNMVIVLLTVLVLFAQAHPHPPL